MRSLGKPVSAELLLAKVAEVLKLRTERGARGRQAKAWRTHAPPGLTSLAGNS